MNLTSAEVAKIVRACLKSRGFTGSVTQGKSWVTDVSIKGSGEHGFFTEQDLLIMEPFGIQTGANCALLMSEHRNSWLLRYQPVIEPCVFAEFLKEADRNGNWYPAHATIKARGLLVAQNSLLSPTRWYEMDGHIWCVISHTQIQYGGPAKGWQLPEFAKAV